MIIVMKADSSKQDLDDIERRVRELGYMPHRIEGDILTVVAAVGDESTHASLEALSSHPAVDKVMPVQKKHKLISRETHPDSTLVSVGAHVIGGDRFHIIAGPCSVESAEQVLASAKAVAHSGGTILRGGAYKPRTSPYDFQGLGVEGLHMLQAAKTETGLPVVTEVVSAADIPAVVEVADMLQIGARNGLNYALLEAVADTGKPILLKRSMAATINEWLLAAEYIVKRGNRNVVLCERGIRTFENATRNTLDISAVAIAKLETTLPVIVDPTHAGGRLDIIVPLAKAAIAAGADGLIVEVHPDPKSALSDAGQQMKPDEFASFMREIEPIVTACGRQV